jgi:UDP-N-acetylglucosamine 4-epimerase
MHISTIEPDISDGGPRAQACTPADYVLHPAALGSVPRSIENPAASHDKNVTGFLNILNAAREAGVKRFVYASSSAVYGDEPNLPKVEHRVGRPLSPYGATKAMNEIYADVFARCYGFQTIGLRYFNVFGPRQDPDGPYAAVIPKWIDAMIKGDPIVIYGDGETSRDFCYVANVVQGNLLAALVEDEQAVNQVYNIAVGGRTTLIQLFELIQRMLLPHCSHLSDYKPEFRDFRAGDVRHSHADISKAQNHLGYLPTHTIEPGMAEALDWYRQATTPASSG